MLHITRHITIPENEIDFNAVRSQGSGGQNVNKVATAIHLRFNINDSSLPEYLKERLMKIHDSRITKSGEIVIKAQGFRSQEKNKRETLNRLQELIRKAIESQFKKRKIKQVSKAYHKKRVENKRHKGKIKELRKKINY